MAITVIVILVATLLVPSMESWLTRFVTKKPKD